MQLKNSQLKTIATDQLSSLQLVMSYTEARCIRWDFFRNFLCESDRLLDAQTKRKKRYTY